MSALAVESVSKSFAGLNVLRGVDFRVDHGVRQGIVGPNGAGKTTLMNVITGWLPIDAGDIKVDGKSCVGLAPEAISHLGVSRSFQINRLFGGLSVLENLRLGCQSRAPMRFNFFRDRDSFTEVADNARQIAETVGLTGVLDRAVEELSYGQKRQLEVGMALSTGPSILLLDEPFAGMSPKERVTLLALLKKLPSSVTVLLVEHDMDIVFDFCDRLTVLNYGKVIADGELDEVRRSPEVQKAYLGDAHA